MLKDFNGLTQQIFEKPFRNMLYSIYNFADEEFYIHGLRNLGYDTDIDNLEFISLDIDNVTNDEISSFKVYIENEVQHYNVVIGVLFFKGKNGILPIVIKPKSVNVEDVLKQN